MRPPSTSRCGRSRLFTLAKPSFSKSSLEWLYKYSASSPVFAMDLTTRGNPSRCNPFYFNIFFRSFCNPQQATVSSSSSRFSFSSESCKDVMLLYSFRMKPSHSAGLSRGKSRIFPRIFFRDISSKARVCWNKNFNVRMFMLTMIIVLRKVWKAL